MKTLLKSFAALSLIALAGCSSSSGGGNNGPAAPGSGSPADQKAISILTAHAWCYNIQTQDGSTVQVRDMFSANGSLNLQAFRLVNGSRPAQPDLEKNGSYTIQNTDTTTTLTTTVDNNKETSTLEYTAQDQVTGAERVYSTDAQKLQTAWDPCI